jgi:hypothetical protein
MSDSEDNRRSFYHYVWNLLYDTGNINCRQESIKAERLAFVTLFLESPACTTREWRFSGHLGFGGKFWRNDGRHYVNMYREDSTPERERVLSSLNEAIGQLEKEHNVR